MIKYFSVKGMDSRYRSVGVNMESMSNNQDQSTVTRAVII